MRQCFVFFVADGLPGAVDTLTGGAGATVSVAVGAAAVVPGVMVDDVSVIAVVSVFVTPVLLCAVSVLTTSRCPHPASVRRIRVAAIRFMTCFPARILPA